MKDGNIVLIGFMGTGKTAVGRRLAEILGREFIDTDGEVERALGKPVARIFAEDGEARFRAEEAEVCRRLAGCRGLVIATGGGIVLNPENVRHLRQNGILIALTAAPEEIYRRLSGQASPASGGRRRTPEIRPLLQGDMRARIQELLRARAGAYAVADWSIDTTGRTVEDVVRAIVGYLEGKGYLDQERGNG